MKVMNNLIIFDEINEQIAMAQESYKKCNGNVNEKYWLGFIAGLSMAKGIFISEKQIDVKDNIYKNR